MCDEGKQNNDTMFSGQEHAVSLMRDAMDVRSKEFTELIKCHLLKESLFFFLPYALRSKSDRKNFCGFLSRFVGDIDSIRLMCEDWSEDQVDALIKAITLIKGKVGLS